MKQKYKYVLGVVGVLIALVYLGFINIDTSTFKDKIPSLTKSVAGDVGQVTSVALGRQEPITSLIVWVTEKYSNTQNPTGNLLVFAAGTNPKDPSAKLLTNIDPGVAYTSKDLVTNRLYRVVYNDSTTHYAKDLGDIVLATSDEFTAETGNAFVDLTQRLGFKPAKVATLSDILDETATSGIINGHTDLNITVTTVEIGCIGNCAADINLTYDESNGDGEVYIEPTFATTGAQAELQEAVITFAHESGAAPEGNEISAMTFQLQSGTDLQIPTSVNWPSVWANEESVVLNNGQPLPSGISSKYRITITYEEANLDTSDDFKMCFDDLLSKGNGIGKDDYLNVGATQDCIDFDAQA